MDHVGPSNAHCMQPESVIGSVLKTLTQVDSYVVCIQSRRHVQKGNTEKDIKKKSQDVLFSEKQVFQFCLLSVWDLLLLRKLPFLLFLATSHNISLFVVVLVLESSRALFYQILVLKRGSKSDPCHICITSYIIQPHTCYFGSLYLILSSFLYQLTIFLRG